MLLLSCSQPIKTDDQFLACWGVQSAPNGLRLIQFEAVIYPRAGALSASNSCPGFVLNLQFDQNLPRPTLTSNQVPGVDPYGVRGRALVSVVSREAPDRMSVRVRRVVAVNFLPEAETRAAIARLN